MSLYLTIIDARSGGPNLHADNVIPLIRRVMQGSCLMTKPQSGCAPDPIYDRRRGAAVQIDGQHLAVRHLRQRLHWFQDVLEQA